MADSGEFKRAALHYHSHPVPGKLEIVATKPLATQHDLSLAYSPGVAAACEAIAADSARAADYTTRSNLVAVVSNGTAVLGLGDIGPLAAKPVMEGKAVLFKKFAGIDAFDIEINERDPHRLAAIIASLEPTFGGINLEDISAPSCFILEEELGQRVNIPVLHDDQHGTAIIVAAAVRNALQLVDKELASVRLVASGAGAAAIACLELLVGMGLPRQNIIVTDRQGVVHTGRDTEMDPWKRRYAIDTAARTLDEVIADADVFLGLSAPGVLSAAMVRKMAGRPIIMALANPEPEIRPEQVREACPEAIIATGRSDYPNQVNNVLCFPFIFRGALDTGATTITLEMKLACVEALAELARAEPSDVVARSYGGNMGRFGPDYLLPRPFDPRLLCTLAPAVARAAMASGVATRPLEDLDAYQARLSGFVFKSGFLMKPLFDRARERRKRLVFAEGESNRVLQAAQQLVDGELAEVILVGREDAIRQNIDVLGLRIRPGQDIEVVDLSRADEAARAERYGALQHQLRGRQGLSPIESDWLPRVDTTVAAALLLASAEADAMLCGVVGRYAWHLERVRAIVGLAPGVQQLSAMEVLVLPSGTFFICDTHVSSEPNAAELAETVLMAADKVRRFGITPRVALVSQSNFGTRDDDRVRCMRDALTRVREADPELEVDGEMHTDAALSAQVRARALSSSSLKGQANLLVMPNVDAAHIAYNLLRMLGGGVNVGPILMGTARPCHVLTYAVTVRGLVNMAALAVTEAQHHQSD